MVDPENGLGTVDFKPITADDTWDDQNTSRPSHEVTMSMLQGLLLGAMTLSETFFDVQVCPAIMSGSDGPETFGITKVGSSNHEVQLPNDDINPLV